ncbi:MAG: PAS domain S-box protein [Thermoplasmatota archaeon]
MSDQVEIATPFPDSEDDKLASAETVSSLKLELSQLKENYEHLLKYAPSGVYEVDLVNQKFLSCNDAILDILGYNRQEFLSLSPMDILSEESRIRFLQRLESLFKGEMVSDDVEYSIVAKNGSEIWVRINPTYVYRGSSLVGAHVIVHDLTHIKEVQNTAKEIEERFHMVFDNAQELIVVLQDGRVKFINNLKVLAGENPGEEVFSTGFLDFVHPDDREESMERYLKRISGEVQPSHHLLRIRTAAGDYRWAEVKSIFIEWEGSPATLNFITDVHEKVETENELRRTQDKYRTVVENAREAMAIVKDGRINFINQGGASLIGYKIEELESLDFVDVIHPDDRERAVEDHLRVFNRDEYGLPKLYRFLHKNGSIRWGEVNSTPLREEGHFTMLSFIADVTDRVEAENQLILEKSKSEFYLDLLGHDIGNLMQGISAWIEMARIGGEVDDRIALCLDHAWHLSERSKRLVKNVLILSRIRDKEPDLRPVDILPVINRTIEEADKTFPSKKIDFKIIDNGLYPRVIAEPIVEEMFFNPIHNAIKFQTRVEPKVMITLEQPEEGMLRISIADWGPGISEQQKSGIFKRFKDITGKKYTGIGLALTKELVDRYGGSIWVEDNIEDDKVVGAMFVLELPVLS